MRIYTKTGDQGQTGLIGGSRVDKSDPRIAAIGDVDELNAAIGLCRTLEAPEALDPILADVQNTLFDLGAELASPHKHARMHRQISHVQVEELERSIDLQTAALPPLQHFILPGGCELGARLHFARCVCRRAERTVCQVSEVSDAARIYLNRLSDWLFTAARTANLWQNVPDVIWQNKEAI